MEYRLKPIPLKVAHDFTEKHHRHNGGTQGHKFSIGLVDKDDNLVGVVTVGRPIARRNDDGKTAEVTRCCVLEDNLNANSMLYGAACRACKAMGYESVITYTLLTESGSSLKGAGFVNEGEIVVKKKGWNVPSRPRETLEVSTIRKQRWRRILK